MNSVALSLRLSPRIVEDGQERVEVEEDGELKSVLVNGKEQKPKVWNSALIQHVL